MSERTEYTEPRILITSVEPTITGAIVEGIANANIGEPICPGILFKTNDDLSWTYELHRVLEKNESRLKLESFALTTSLPVVGTTYFYRGLLTKSAIEAITDKTSQWTLVTHPNDEEHAHCLISFEEISADHSENSKAYFSEKHGWLTKESYEKYIAADILKLRS